MYPYVNSPAMAAALAAAITDEKIADAVRRTQAREAREARDLQREEGLVVSPLGWRPLLIAVTGATAAVVVATALVATGGHRDDAGASTPSHDHRSDSAVVAKV